MPRGICSHGTNDQVRNNAAVLFWAALFGAGCVFCATSAREEILYDRDGIQLQGTARIITYNAATCHVLKESLPESRYEELKAHDGTTAACLAVGIFRLQRDGEGAVVPAGGF